jgi:hypothetical protein
MASLYISSFFTSFPNIKFTHDVGDVPYQDVLKYTELKEAFCPQKYRNKKVILLIRGPREVVVSFYYHKKHRQRALYGITKFDGEINEFVFDDVYGLKKVVQFMNLWADYYQNFEMKENICILKYEDLHKDAFKQTKEY